MPDYLNNMEKANMGFHGQTVHAFIRFSVEDDDQLILRLPNESKLLKECDKDQTTYALPATDGERIAGLIEELNRRYIQLYHDIMSGAHDDEITTLRNVSDGDSVQ